MRKRDDESDALTMVLLIVIIVSISLLTMERPPKYTADQIYGCTIAEQAPNGDCK